MSRPCWAMVIRRGWMGHFLGNTFWAHNFATEHTWRILLPRSLGPMFLRGLGVTFSFHISGANVFSLKMGWAHFVNAAVRAHVISQRSGATLCCTTCWAKWLLFSFCKAGCDPFGYQFFVSTKSCILRPLVVMGFA